MVAVTFNSEEWQGPQESVPHLFCFSESEEEVMFHSFVFFYVFLVVLVKIPGKKPCF